MFDFLKKKNKETFTKIIPKVGEPIEVILGGQPVKVMLKKPLFHEELAIASFAEKAAQEFINLTGSIDVQIQARVVAEAGCRAFAYYCIYQPDGQTKLFRDLDATKKFKGKDITVDELATITQIWDAIFSVPEQELKN